MENQKIKEEILEEEVEKQTEFVEEETKENVEEPQLTEEQIQKIEEEKRIREEFNKEEGIQFQQTITKDDAFNFNMYLLKNPSNFTRRIFTGLLGLILIIFIIVNKDMYWLIIFGILMIIYSVFFYGPLQKYLTKKMFNKKEFNDLKINVKFASKIMYELDDEQSSPLVDYGIIYKVVETNDYIFLHIDIYSIMIIKLSDCSQKDELRNMLKEKFQEKYKSKTK